MQKTLVLRSQADRRIKKGHLWVYSNEVDTKRTPLNTFESGEIALLASSNGQVLGQVFVNPKALICGRVLCRDAQQLIDVAWLSDRLRDALALREQVFREPYYRLCYGDSDGLPGLVIDRFGAHCVVQVSGAGFDALLPQVLEALDKVCRPSGVIVRNNHQARSLEGLEQQLESYGEVPEELTVVENGCRFHIPATEGQKTGWFYDHRINRAFLQTLVRGRSVLDVFSYMGGWGLEAAVAGADAVTCVDVSELALEYVRKNAALNGVEAKTETLCGKAVDVLKQLVNEQRRFDVIVLDPPAFIKKRKDQKSGEAAYRHLNELCMRLLNPGGVLVSASCSMPLQEQTLIDIVHAAAHKQGRSAQLFYTGNQSPDHPIHPYIPETRYLKGQFYWVR